MRIHEALPLALETGIPANVLKQGWLVLLPQRVESRTVPLSALVVSADLCVNNVIEKPIAGFVLEEHGEELGNQREVGGLEEFSDKAKLAEFDHKPRHCLTGKKQMILLVLLLFFKKVHWFYLSVLSIAECFMVDRKFGSKMMSSSNWT